MDETNETNDDQTYISNIIKSTIDTNNIQTDNISNENQIMEDIQKVDEKELNESSNNNDKNSSDEDSNDSSSSSECTSDSESDPGQECGETQEEQEYRLAQMMNEGSKSSTFDPIFGPKTVNEQLPSSIGMEPLPEDVKIDDEVEVCGKVLSLNANRKSVVVESAPAAGDAKICPFDMDSVICTVDRQLVGRIEEVFGPVVKPFYLVRLMGLYDPEFTPVVENTIRSMNESKENTMTDDAVDDKNAENAIVDPPITDAVDDSAPVAAKLILKPDDVLYTVKRHMSHIDITVLNQSGSDASNIHDEEPNEDELDYSDDEKEALAKRKDTRGKVHPPQPTNLNSDAASRSANQPEARRVRHFEHSRGGNRGGSRGGKRFQNQTPKQATTPSQQMYYMPVPNMMAPNQGTVPYPYPNMMMYQHAQYQQYWHNMQQQMTYNPNNQMYMPYMYPNMSTAPPPAYGDNSGTTRKE